MPDILTGPAQGETTAEQAWRESYDSVCRKLDRERQAHQMSVDMNRHQSNMLLELQNIVPGLVDWMRETFEIVTEICEKGEFAYAAGYAIGAANYGIARLDAICDTLGIDPVDARVEVNPDD